MGQECYHASKCHTRKYGLDNFTIEIIIANELETQCHYKFQVDKNIWLSLMFSTQPSSFEFLDAIKYVSFTTNSGTSSSVICYGYIII